MSLPPKRVLTEEKRANGPLPVNNGIDEELAARLRNMATRVRKSATEGYAPSAPGAPNIPRITSRLPFTRSASFQSANDALKEAYASHANKAFASSGSTTPNVKRKLTAGEAGGDDDDDDDIDLDGDASDLRIPAGQFQANDSMRPVKPLPAARRGGMRSFSEGALPYGRRTNATLIAPGLAIEEEDWSQGSFAPASIEPPQ